MGRHNAMATSACGRGNKHFAYLGIFKTSSQTAYAISRLEISIHISYTISSTYGLNLVAKSTSVSIEPVENLPSITSHMAKRKAKKVNPTWTLEAEVLLLNWLDDNKGTDGALRQNDEAAWNEFVAGDEFVRQHMGIQDFSTEEEKRQHIQLRLRYLWSNFRSTFYAETPFTKTIIYTQGSAALDWGRLENRYRSLYTPEEYQTRKALAELATSTPGGTGGKRKIREEEDLGDGTVDGSGDSSRQKRLRQQIRETPGQTISSSSSPTEINSGPGTSRSQPQHLLSAAMLPPLSRIERRTRQDAMLSDLELSKLPKFKRLLGDSWDERAQLTDVLKLQTQMMKIYTQIERSVNEYMGSCAVDNFQPIVLRPESAYPRDLNKLLSLILGGHTGQVEERRALFQSLRDEKVISYTYFIRSLLIAAVMDWCLRPAVEEARIYRSYGGGVIQQVFESSLDPVVEMRLRQKLVESYVKMEIEPQIPSKAKDMASIFQGFVDLILPRHDPCVFPHQVTDVKSCPRTDPDRPNTAADLPALFEESGHRINFRQDLYTVFETTLQWRAEKDKMMHERYSFSFPSFGDEYVKDGMIQEMDSEGNKRAKPVILCLLPLLYRSIAANLLDDIGFPHKVVNGIVL
ncbi:hypothetical protein PV04_03026 [Phialophora macrospora]|uniref:Uncharacterized protein n=1 Tax=Phialophora macrospora TaxID=1851006 RepID=A0A0D2FWC1_9EURO|nr:hypothetical protein PV04_03026 [Phialophora macrospora]